MWTDLPPPPPRTDSFSQPLTRPYPPEELTHSRLGEHHHLQMEKIMVKPMPIDKPGNPPYGGPSFMREEQFMRPREHSRDYRLHPIQLAEEQFTPNFLGPPFSREPQSQMQSFGGDNRAARSQSGEEFSKPVRDFSFSAHMGGPGNSSSSLSRYSSSLLEAGSSKFSSTMHYNPFASTFEQSPTRSKFNSRVFRREMDPNFSSKYDSPFSLSHVPPSGQSSSARLGSTHTASPPDSNRLGVQLLPRSGVSLPMGVPGDANNRTSKPDPLSKQHGIRDSSGGDQYDPIFDSIEPSSNTSRKFDPAQLVDESSPTLKSGTLRRPATVEENNKQKSGSPDVINLLEKEDFDETGTEEVGDLDNISPGNPVDTGGEIEIDQAQSAHVKKKKSNDSRSMKLFKIAIADFVKEVLKPSWRQGNMSKEAFKTIVKKTVDKVSGAMKGHQVPKSQAKIDQYVESSQRKLTKLVMGYVDKYVKV